MIEVLPRRLLEWVSAFTMMSWGVILSTPLAELDREVVRDLVGNGIPGLAIMCSLIGFLRVGALIINGSWRPTPHARAVGAAVSAVFYSQLIVSMMEAGGPSAGLAVYPALLAGEIYVTFRASREASINDARARRQVHGSV